MTNKILAIAMVVFAVVLYTMGVIDFANGNVAGGVSNVIMACSDVIMAVALWQLAFMEKVLKITCSQLPYIRQVQDIERKELHPV